MPLQIPVPLGQVTRDLASIGEQIRAQVGRRALTPYVIAPGGTFVPVGGAYYPICEVLVDIGQSGMALVFVGSTITTSHAIPGTFLDIDNTGIPVANSAAPYLATGLAANTHNFRALAQSSPYLETYLLVCPL